MQEVEAQLVQSEIQRLIASETLRNSDSLRRLLSYLGTALVEGRAREVKEYTIGRDVMGKPESYDPRVDASVRVQIGKLRQRLDHYYTAEAPEAPVQIRLPKGHFELALERRAEPPTPPEAAAAAHPVWRRIALALGGLSLLLSVAVGVLIWRQQRQAPGELPRAVHRYWSPFLEGSKPLTVVLGSPLFVRFHSKYFRDPEFNDWAEVRKALPLERYRQMLESPTAPMETRRWTPFGEAVAAFRLAAVLGRYKEEVVLKRSVSLAWEDIRSANLVFLGPPKFNPQLRDLPLKQDFVIEGGAVRNLRPLPGEPDSFMKPSAPNEDDIPEDYAVITRVSGLEGWGEILVLASTSTEGTWAAADYVTRETHVTRMIERLQSGSGRVPASYQVLIRSRFKSQVPIQSEYVTHRVLREARSDQEK